MPYNLLIVVAVIVGVVAGLIISKLHYKSQLALLNNNLDELRNNNIELELELKQQNVELLNYTKEAAAAQNELTNSAKRIAEQKNNLDEVTARLKYEFENLASRIFEEKSTKFTEQNKLNLSVLLTPLGERIKDFESKVNEVYDKESKERVSLKTQIEELSKLNKVMNEETRNLTRALKGDTKLQGNWGEMILESILEKSGLVKDVEYKLQLTLEQDNQRYRPDVIIYLPDNKALVIDSKVSLTAYERYVSLENHDNPDSLKEHVQSIRSHIKNLSGKNYQGLYTLNSVDFVMMFIPIEAAYLLALRQENNLIEEALSKNIILVCPSSLLATLRTVYNVWRSEKSLQNANQIAQIGGDLYKRFVDLLDALAKIKKSLDLAQNNYTDAVTKLQGNKGVIKSVEKLRELGVNKKTAAVIGSEWLE
jgi:DNA recombination protein RmuC